MLQTWFGLFDRDTAQQVGGIHFGDLAPDGSGSVWDKVGFDSPNPHEPLHALAVYPQFDRHLAASGKICPLQVELVELAEQTQVFRALRLRLVVVARARHSQQFALLLNAQVRMSGIDPWAFVFSR